MNIKFDEVKIRGFAKLIWSLYKGAVISKVTEAFNTVDDEDLLGFRTSAVRAVQDQHWIPGTIRKLIAELIMSYPLDVTVAETKKAILNYLRDL